MARPPKEGGTPKLNMYEGSPHFWVGDGVMIQNQAGHGLAPLGNFRKMPKGARPTPDDFSNLRVSAIRNH